MAKSGFYAVAAGRSPGIFTSWSEAEEQIRGFSGARYKKFPSQAEAQAFIDQFNGTTATDSIGSAKTAVTKDQVPKKSTKKGESWYAVARGHKTGVFQTWNEAKQQVEGMRSAKFKKFPTQEEAQAFVDQHAAATQTQPSDPDPKDPNTLVAFCDGSALQNGQRGCQAGYACIFPHHTEWNVATKLVEDRATNNRAEYLAGLEALKRANIENPDGNRVLYIFSDSMLLIRSMTEWVGTWQKNGWKKSDGAAVMNRDLLELLVKETDSRRVLWRHVKAHTGKQDWKSKWNDVADNAARDAAMSC
ncbi:hypothetical protein G195_008734 [Phytophthora kernoviae 00238/432]|uniref:ribonuclease H n=1 Tax=Phytophthora kernoviae 00238/432 TaxID=1284355 RepID=A0A8J4RZU3_9STRA|nr:hypothetical protein G195_008734 [Phytophthora kernoviae 00238/432]